MKCLRYLFPLFLLFVLVKPVQAGRVHAEDVFLIDSNGDEVTLQSFVQNLPAFDGFPNLTGLTATATQLNEITNGGQTSLHTHASGSTTKTLDGAYNDDSGERTVTVDDGDVSWDLNDATNDNNIVIDNTTTGEIDNAMEINTTGAGGTFVDGIDVSDDGITNAINVGANDIEGAAATITFTDFTVSADGLVAISQDGDGDALTATGHAGDFQALVANADTNNSTSTAGIIDVDLGTVTSGASAMDIALTVDSGAGANNEHDGISMTLTNNDADGEIVGLDITAAATANAGADSYTALIRLSNAEDTAGAVTDGILITTSSGTDTDITDAIDASAADITNALNVGGNTITGTSYTLGTAASGDITISTGSGALVMPNNAAPTVATTGAISLDTTIADHQPLFRFYDGDEEALIISIPSDQLTATDGQVIAYNATDDEFEMVAGASSLDDAYNNGQSITVDTGAGLTLTNAASQSLVIDSDTTNSTEVNGALDIDVGSTTASVHAIEIALTQDSGATANAENVGIELTLQGDDADGELVGLDIIASATANAAADTYTAGIRISNAENTASTMTDAILIDSTSGTNADIVDGIDVSDANITNAINIGANEITGTNFRVDTVGHIYSGTGGGGGGNVGTGILTFVGGGVIDSTDDGDIEIVPQDAGLVKFPSGVTVRFPPNSPGENRNGLYYDTANNKICIDDDDGTDRCTAAISMASLSLDPERSEALSTLFRNDNSFNAFRTLMSDPSTMERVSKLADAFRTPAELDEFAKLADEARERYEEIARFDDNAIKNATNILMQDGYLYTYLKDKYRQKRTGFVDVSSQPTLFDRGSANLTDGEVYIPLKLSFLSLVDIDKRNPQYRVQVTPTSMDVNGPLVVLKSEKGFKVIDKGAQGNGQTSFDWEVSAVKRRDFETVAYPAQYEFEKTFLPIDNSLEVVSR